MATIHWDEPRQSIHGFGASDAWSVQFVGTWPSEKRNRIADLLFSQKMGKEGHPKGIGLSIWRFNIGAGSVEQGEASGIRSEWRRAEGFLQELRDGEMVFDWSRHPGQRWFLRAAKERGVATIIGFSNSPPVEMTKNGKGYGNGSGTSNLADDHYDDFPAFLASVADHFKQKGLAFDYLSPVNEPQWNWSQDDNQEGSPYTNDELTRVVGTLNKELADRGLSTQVEIPETARLDFLYDAKTKKPRRDNQISHLFGRNKLQRLSHVAPKVAAHSYFTTWPISKMIRQRRRVAEQIRGTDSTLEYWMSEYCILADNEEIQGPGRDLGMDPALYVARVIHADLTVAHASSWQWWLGVSPGDFKDGLVYVDRDTKAIHDSKLLWGLGNYSRFLRPGARRVVVRRSDDVSLSDRVADGLVVSAYRAADGERPVVVAVNQEQSERALRLTVVGDGDVSGWRPYVTSARKDLFPQGERPVGDTLTVPARSIVTFVGTP